MREVDVSLVSQYVMVQGLGDLADNKACVVAQAAILDALSRGENLIAATDQLDCACPALRVFAIALNDGDWWPGGDAERTRILTPLLGALLDSRVSPRGTAKRVRMAAEYAKYAAEYAKSAAEYATEANSRAGRAAKFAADYAELAADYVRFAAEYAKCAAEYATEANSFAAGKVALRDKLLAVWWEMEAVK